MAKKWMIQAPSADRDALADQCKVPSIVAQLLINRGLHNESQTQTYLESPLIGLHSPQLLSGAQQAAEMIVQAIENKTKIVLYGDYDVDGTTGVAVLWHMLRQAGAEVSFYVPHRIHEGYGLNSDAVNQLIDHGAGMIISVDCGIKALTIADEIRKKNVKFIITDHHSLPDTLPTADVIVHPALNDSYPNPDLCGAGVAFKLAWSIAQVLSKQDKVNAEYRTLLMDLLPLVALGTIADVVPLIEENRIIARHGLKFLSNTSIPGLLALISAASLDPDKISGYDVGFKLAPRINAAGRMGHARLAVELFTRADENRAREIAMYLEEHNRTRQSTERKISKQAFEIIELQDLASDSRRAIVLAYEGWHPGVIGIVASRIVDRYQRPAVMIALSNGVGQGSARSIRHFELAEALSDCDDYLISHGGHSMAAGLNIATDRVKPFSEAFIELANRRLTGDDLIPVLRLDAEIVLEELSLPTVEIILGMGPFGMGNPKPKLVTDWVELSSEPRCVGRNEDHLQATFCEGGRQMKAIGFGLGSKIEDLKQHRKCRVAFEPMINDFRGRRSVEMQILDLQFPS